MNDEWMNDGLLLQLPLYSHFQAFICQARLQGSRLVHTAFKKAR